MLLLDRMTDHTLGLQSMLLSDHIFLLIHVPIQDHFALDTEFWSEHTLHYVPESVLLKCWFLMYVISSQSLAAISRRGNKVLLLLLKNDHFSSDSLRCEHTHITYVAFYTYIIWFFIYFQWTFSNLIKILFYIFLTFCLLDFMFFCI